MRGKKPLSQYVDEQITFFNLEDTKKNRTKLKMKFQRSLIELGLWDSAEQQVIGRKKTRVFSEEELNILSRHVQNYLIKLANWNQEAIKKSEKESLEEMERLQLSFAEDDEAKYNFDAHQELRKTFGPLKVSQEEEIYVMTKAIFELFFTPLDVKTWNADRKLVYYTNPLDKAAIKDIKYLTAKERLKNPSFYFSRKPNDK
ncbi:hypothetical protein [Streptococcus anginosus]|uniref:hypothetical protein n=1 Tax=Streptococcus anginosus TaxID=1328 RepID=UPI000D092197|nr:hypothetical protein [Streptococcus anginosus]PRT78656.1 hypothetical protein C6A31_03720 [Streptococcus anginosus]